MSVWETQLGSVCSTHKKLLSIQILTLRCTLTRKREFYAHHVYEDLRNCFPTDTKSHHHLAAACFLTGGRIYASRCARQSHYVWAVATMTPLLSRTGVKKHNLGLVNKVTCMAHKCHRLNTIVWQLSCDFLDIFSFYSKGNFNYFFLYL